MVQTMVKGYDKLRVDYGMLLDLPFNEGIGAVTRDIAKPHHQNVALVHAPTWERVDLSNTPVLDFDGANDYLECPAAATIDLDFTFEDYSILCWINPLDTGGAEMIMGRYALDGAGNGIGGWELFLFAIGGGGSLNSRHSHATLGAGNEDDSCFSTGWFPGSWVLIGVSRSGLYPVHYRDGVPLAMTYGPSGMRNPDAIVQDLVIGVRFSKNANYYKGKMKRPRIINRALTASDMRDVFEMERHLFGV